MRPLDMMSRLPSLSRLREIDWDFAGSYSESPFSATHWHPGRFVSQVPAALIGTLSSPGDVVLDPFVGSGTTLVEAQRLGRQSIGVDLNPVSCLVSEAKTLRLPSAEISARLKRLTTDATAALGPLRFFQREVARARPQQVQLEKWYNARVAHDLVTLWELVHSYVDQVDRLLGVFGLSAILLTVCRETRHWGYVCDNTTPVGESGQDVLRCYSKVLAELEQSYKMRDLELAARGTAGKIAEACVIRGDAREKIADLEPGSVDLVVTSPPYFGVCDYIKAQRLTLEWLGVGIEELRLREIGARSKRHRASARLDYIEEMRKTSIQLARVLREGGTCALVIGQSASRQNVLADLREGFSQARLAIVLDLNRTVSSQRRQHPSIKGEHIVVLEKTG